MNSFWYHHIRTSTKNSRITASFYDLGHWSSLRAGATNTGERVMRCRYAEAISKTRILLERLILLV